VNGYIAPTIPPTDATGKNPSEHNAKAMNVILIGLSKSKFVKVMHCKLEKDIWNRIQNIY
jgi:hypothetical protein